MAQATTLGYKVENKPWIGRLPLKINSLRPCAARKFVMIGPGVAPRVSIAAMKATPRGSALI